MTRFMTLAFLVAVAMVWSALPAAAQATTTLSGTVVDSAGGVIPGANVVASTKGTGTKFSAVTDGNGSFTVPALNPGVYTVNVSLMGFKTAVIDEVRLQPGIPASLKATLEVGGLEETVVVDGGLSLVNTQTPMVAATLNVDQINQMPLPTRNALNAVTFLPGVNTAGINRDANVNGLPQSFINITLDGVGNNDQFNKTSDGFFASVTPRQDAVEAVTVTMAAGGADVGGHGAVGINFVTRSGTNSFTGSAYEYTGRRAQLELLVQRAQRPAKNDVKLNQYGVRQGGPIVIAGVYDGHNKAFFFVNYEEVRLPNNFSRTRTMLDPRRPAGLVPLQRDGRRRAAGARGQRAGAGRGERQLATIDPTVARVFGFMSSAASTGTLNLASDPLLNDYVWQSPGNQTEKQPVIRLDYNLGVNHRLSGTYNQIWVVRDPDHLNSNDRRFPDVDQLRQVRLDPSDPVAGAALHARPQPRQRAARRHHQGRRLVLRAGREQRHSDVR